MESDEKLTNMLIFCAAPLAADTKNAQAGGRWAFVF